MSKSPPGIRVTIPPDLRAWIEAEAEELGCDAATWLRMLAVDARRQGRKLAFPQYRQPYTALHPSAPSAPPPDDDAWRGPVEDEQATSADIAAVIERGLAEAEAQGATEPPAAPTEMFARQPPQQTASGATRAIARPPSRYAPAAQPAHLRAL